MDFCFGLQQGHGVSITLWISLSLLYSMLCMWSNVEGWSYHYSNTTMDWQTARTYCQDNYTDMVAIQNQEEISHLISILPRQKRYYWIGIRKVQGVWTWVGTNKALTAEAENWAATEPNNLKNNEDCVEMYIKRLTDNGKWNDESCMNEKMALCYTASCQSDSCYHGECVETINRHQCACFEGFYGEKCENVVQCKKEEVTVPAKANVSCSHPNGDFAYDSTCQYSCEEGYQLSSSGTLRCTASEYWSEQPPTCELKKCSQLHIPVRASMDCSHPLGAFSYLSTCAFSCEEGYVLVASSSPNLQCGASGSWNDSQPQCAAVHCPALQDPEDGFMACGEDMEMRFSFGYSCSFSCAEGFRLQGASTVSCTAAATWSDKTPRCEAIRCMEPMRGAHLHTECDGTPDEFWPTSTCRFSCDAGFQLHGADSIQCTGTGEWNTDTPTCTVKKCSQLHIPVRASMDCSHPLGAFSYLSTCAFSCEEGYVLVASSSPNLQCGASGSWNDSQPQCAAVHCPALQDPEDGSMACGEDMEMRFSFGYSCSFSCAEGFRLQGASTVSCTAAATWSDKTPRCEALQCPPPEVPLGGQVSCVAPSLSGGTPHPWGSVCAFSCDEGYDHQGALSTECTGSGEWSAVTPTCTVVRCPSLQAPVNGYINCSFNASDELIYGSECSFTCDQRHTVHGPEAVTCNHYGNWTGEVPVCKALPEPLVNPTTMGLAAGGTASLSGLFLAAWLLKRLKQNGKHFDLNSTLDIEEHPQSYKNSIDSLI